MNTYYNTTAEAKPQADLFCAINSKQNDLVLEIATSLKIPFGASTILNNYPNNMTPLTSIRRSLNTLEHQGKISKTGEKAKGIYGRNENLYRVNL